jgi:hypothetical protein
VIPTDVCPPTGLYATNELPLLAAATWVAPEASVTTFWKSLFSVVTPAISGWPALCAPRVKGAKSRFVE